MKYNHILPKLVLFAVLFFIFPASARAAYYSYTLTPSYSNGKASATLTCTRDGQKIWTYNTGSYQPWSEVTEFSLILNNADGYLRNNGVYLAEHGSIKRFNMDTGEVLWTNDDFMGGTSYTDGCYTFSSSGKLYISGHYGPDLFVVDSDGRTICRVESLPLTGDQFWPEKMWFDHGDYLSIQYESDGSIATFNVLDYFNRMDGLSNVSGMDLAPFLGNNAGVVKDTFGIREEIMRGVLYFDSGMNDMIMWCVYDSINGWRNSRVDQIDLYENSEGKYRLGSIMFGLKRSDSQYYLYNEGYQEVKTEELSGGSYESLNVNKSNWTVYCITYSQYGWIEKIVYRRAYQSDIDLCN